jgi:hypothetical protein
VLDLGRRCERRHADLGRPYIHKGYLSTGATGTVYSTLGCYSSDIGSIVVRYTTGAGIGGKFALACPTTDLGNIANVYGFLAGFDSDSSNLNSQQYIAPGSTQKIYVEKFDYNTEYSIDFSTANSTVLPGTSDINSLAGFATTHFAGSSAISITPEYMKLCMSNIASTATPGLAGSTNGSKMFRVTGYDLNRRKLHVVPVQESSSFSW